MMAVALNCISMSENKKSDYSIERVNGSCSQTSGGFSDYNVTFKMSQI